MLDEKIIAGLRSKLLESRRETLEFRREKSESFQELNQREREPEEAAAKENLARGLEQIDSQGKEQIQKIDEALLRMDEGRYGLCEACGNPISVRRLQAAPEARRCIQCAELQENFEQAPVTEPPVTLDEQSLTDEEMLQSIEDALRRDKRVESEELRIRCEAGVVYLDGFLPSEREKTILHEIVQDTLGFKETVDDVAVDRQAWERRERDLAPRREKGPKDIQMEGEDKRTDQHHTFETGEPMTPPDRLTPEKE